MESEAGFEMSALSLQHGQHITKLQPLESIKRGIARPDLCLTHPICLPVESINAIELG